mmetsp:Transcript_19319/g.29107  ORF Transcript_19319/g.29107 Transcript_19319/m.29107 type:complete len:503 (+) Transcript_19319:70-1578(+)
MMYHHGLSFIRGRCNIHRSRILNREIRNTQQNQRFSATLTKRTTPFQKIWNEISRRPVEYASIPCVAAFVGITTNWMGVKMLFYPIEYMGIDWKRWPNTPYGLWGWQGVVPTKTEPMAQRLVDIVTQRLLSLQEAFGRLDPYELSRLCLPAIQEHVERDCGPLLSTLLRPVLPLIVPHLLKALQNEIDSILNLEEVVLSAFVRDKIVLVDLFQKVGRVELLFLVNSGFGFGFLLGLTQMATWAVVPATWTLPVVGALVGYVTNWIAIKCLFEPAEPYQVGNLFVVQGLFESRQVEVSDEFGDFMHQRVLTSQSLLTELADGDEFYDFLRKHLPYPIPSSIVKAAVSAIGEIAAYPELYPKVHSYVEKRLDIEETLSSRLKTLSPTEFEDLLHPVFQEDEIILIATGGVLGLIAGALQTRLGWGGPGATKRAILTIIATLGSSLALYTQGKQEEEQDELLVSEKKEQQTKLKHEEKKTEQIRSTTLRRRKSSIVRPIVRENAR